MATIRCWALHGNISNAINYVLDVKHSLDKTDNGIYVESRGVPADLAAAKWKAAESYYNEKESMITDIVGFHFQQSFEKETVTPEQALEISKKWIEGFLDEGYDYVMAVHTDKEPMFHTHIIVSPRNNNTKKKLQIFFKKDIPILKRLSDEICQQHGLSILPNIYGSGRNYYDWLANKKGDTYKEIISKTIEYLIPKVRDYNEFKTYLQKLGYDIKDGLDDKDEVETLPPSFYATLDNSLFDPSLSSEESLCFRIPGGIEKMYIAADQGEWINDGKTFKVNLMMDNSYDTTFKRKITGLELHGRLDDMTDQYSKRNGFSIKLPNAKKYIRCNRLTDPEGTRYTLENIISRIENNGRLFPDPEITDFINNDKANVKEAQRNFYERANIKMRWMDTPYYKMSKKQKFFYIKGKELQQRFDRLSDIEPAMLDMNLVDTLKSQRKKLGDQLQNIKKEISYQESNYEQIQLDMLAGRIEASENNIKDFSDSMILPLYQAKAEIVDQIKEISHRINIAENKQKKTDKRKNAEIKK